MGLFDFLTPQNGSSYQPPSPQSQGLQALSQALLAAGAPQKFRQSAVQGLGQGLNAFQQAYQGGADTQQLQKAAQATDPQTLMAELSKIQNPDIQKLVLQNRLTAMTPKYEVTKDAFGNPIAYNANDPSKTMPVGGNTGPFAAVGGQQQGGATANAAQLKGDDFLKTLPPQAADQVKALAEGRMQFPGGFALKSPYWQQMISAVSQYDPNFDAVNYNARNKTRSDFTSGKSAQNITSINTAIGHMGALKDSADALDNTKSLMWNSVANYAADQTGDPRIKTFDLNKDAVADELTRVFRGTGGSVSDIEDWKKQLDATNSPAQFQSVMNKGVELLDSRLDSVAQQYNSGMGTTKNGVDLLSPKAQAAYQKLTGQTSPLTNAAQGAQPPKPSVTGKDLGNAILKAKSAIAGGADPAAVRQRLQDNGIDPAQVGL